jgi:aarF domain-containing kinase
LQGIDALGVATINSATTVSGLPFTGSPSSSPLLDDEDVTNLRNLYRLLLLLSRVTQAENSFPVSNIFSGLHFFKSFTFNYVEGMTKR